MANTIERVINIFVKNDTAVQNLDKTSQSLNKVDASTTKVTQSTNKLTESTKTHTEATLKNGGAMGLLNDLTGGLAMTFKDASEAIELAGISMKSFSGVLLATGIGAAILAIGYLVANWEKLKGAIDGSTDAMSKQKAALIELNNERDVQTYQYSNTIAKLESEYKIMEFNKASKADLIKQQDIINKAKQGELEIQSKLNQEELYGKNLRKGQPYTDESLEGRIQKDKEYISLKQKEASLTLDLTDYNNNYNKAIKEHNYSLAENIKIRISSKDEQVKIAKAERINYENSNEDLKRYSELLKSESDINSNIRKLGYSIEEKAAENKRKALDLAIAKNEELRKAEETRYNQLIKMTFAINDYVKAFEKEVNLTKSQLAAKALNGEYNQLVAMYDARAKLLKQQQDSIELAKQGGISKNEQNILDFLQNEIDKYNDLIKVKEKSILVSPEVDSTLTTRLDIIRLNGEAEIASIKGFTFDALRIRKSAMELEGKLREDDLRDKLKKNAELLADNEKNTKSETEKIAIRNDLTKQAYQLTSDLSLEQLNNATAANSINLDMYTEYINRKKDLDNEYYENISIVSQNLQGFLSQLQDENLIKSKDLRNVLLVAEKGLAIAGVVMSTIKANQELKTTAVNEYVSGDAALAQAVFTSDPRAYAAAGLHYKAAASATAGIGLNTAAAGIGIASIIATTLTSWNKPSDAGGTPAGAGAGVAPQFNIVGASGNNQLAAQISASQNQPVNAYVVGSSMSTQQALDRNRIQTATFLALLPFIGLFSIFMI